MTRTQNRTVIVLGLACLYVLFIVLNMALRPFFLSTAPASVRYEWAYRLGQYLAQLVILPGLAVFGWPLGLWMWRRGEIIPQHRTALRVMSACLCLAATVILIRSAGLWFLH